MKSQSPNPKQAQTTIQFLLGPVKIKDGLFMGDQFAAKDIQFIISNKVTHVINTVSNNIPNLYERFGIQYLSVHWTQKQQNIFDKKNNAITAICQFIEEAMQIGESVLIHSMHGKSRACAVTVAYLMKKYSWALNKCLQFVNSKKQGLQIRNNYLSQMQQLQKRIMSEHKLSLSWNQIKNQEDLILANTFYNAKKSEPKPGQSEKKSSKKRVVFADKLVQKTATMTTTSTSGFHLQQNKAHGNKLRPILKGEGDGDKQQEEDGDFKKVGQSDVKPKDDRFVSTINGNIVHVTVNNFITTDKSQVQQQQTPSKIYNTRPFSSDTKDRKQRAYQQQASKIHPSDSSMSSTLKNPYQSKMSGKLGVHTRGTKRKEEPRNLMMIYDRPISAKITDDRKKHFKGVAHNPLAQKLGDMMVTNSSKKRYPSSSHKDDPFKWK